MVTQVTQKVYTPEDYLALEAEAEVRHEFIDGEIVEMPGGTTKHNEIVGNLYFALRLALQGRKLPIYTESVKLWIPVMNTYTYPDVMVLADAPVYHDQKQTVITNPTVIMEVLSDSTRDYDQGGKFGFYRSVNTFQEYVLVEQDQCSVMVYRRGTAKKWSLEIFDNETDTIRLESVGVEIQLQDIYEGV
jgi:Uma2 family endonuclease